MVWPGEAVEIVECGPRDGVSAINRPISPREKLDLIESLSQAGITYLDCVAFTHPRANPNNADAEEVMASIRKRPDITYIGLVSNEVAVRRALATQVDEVCTLVAASEPYNKAMLGCGLRETLNKTLPAVFQTAASGGKSIRAFLLTAFGCPYSGQVEQEQVHEMASRLVHLGAKTISLVDSTGMANPRQVHEMISGILRLNLKANVGVHFHDIRGLGLANCLAAYEAGCRVFDTAIAGFSRTLFGAPNQNIGFGNIPTEDLVHMFEEMGIKTGIDLDKLLPAVELAETIAGRALPGRLLKAQPRKKLLKAPVSQNFM